MNTIAGAIAAHPGEQVAHARRADADERLDELGRGDTEERHAGLARDRAREQRLAAAGRAEQQDALRRHGRDGRVLLRIAQVVDDLRELLLGLLHAGDISERDRAADGAALVELPERLDVAERTAARAEKNSANRFARIRIGSTAVVSRRTVPLAL